MFFFVNSIMYNLCVHNIYMLVLNISTQRMLVFLFVVAARF